MILFPAIDLLDGNAVRLLYGKRDSVTVYGSPLEQAKKWASCGAEWLHLVDLNGAFDGVPYHTGILTELVRTTGCKAQVGGGIRSLDTMERYFDAGVTRVILGTVIFTQPTVLTDAVKRFGGERIVCGMDVRDGKVAIKGWLESVEKAPAALGREMKELGVRTVVFTDVSRDGALTGVNASACAEFARQTGLDVIASGGVRDMEDIRACAEQSLYGVILGKALYEGRLSLDEAIAFAEGKAC